MSVEMKPGIYEMRNGGITGPVSHTTGNRVHPWTDDINTWNDQGNCNADSKENPCDLIRFLAPAASVDNGDGTTTKICTIPVTMKNEAWETHDVVAFREVKNEDLFVPNYGSSEPMLGTTSGYGPRIILAPKTPVVDPYWMELADAIDNGECQPPIGAEKIVITNVGSCLFSAMLFSAGGKQMLWINGIFHGTLPLPTEDKIIDLAAFRKWHAKRGGE